jgi:cephalosporin hydroxylase
MGRDGLNAIGKLSGFLDRTTARIRRLSSVVKHRLFDVAEKFGVHVLPVHFHSPVPSRSEIDPRVYSQRYDDIPGLTIDRGAHLRLLSEIAPYGAELADIPETGFPPNVFTWNNPAISRGDAILYYCLIRHLRPSRIIEIGSGYSTIIAARAVAKNGRGSIVCVEPYPSAPPKRLAAGGAVSLIESPVQSVDLSLFEGLSANDILFIDSTHVSKIGSDVNHELLVILPKIACGVWCHVHDIFLPWELPQAWVEQKHIFWNEQYMVAAFLAFNSAFQIEISNQYVGREMIEDAHKLFSVLGSRYDGGGSLWFKRAFPIAVAA